MFSLPKGLPALEQIAWLCISRAGAWVFTVLLIALFPVFHEQNILYGRSGGASLGGISLGCSKVVVSTHKRVPQERDLKCLTITFKYQDSFSTEKAIN